MSKQKILIFSLFAALFLTTSFAVYSWTEPTTTMPNAYTAPLNTSGTKQVKVGELGASSFIDSDNSNYYINPSGNSVLFGTITVDSPTGNSNAATKGYVDEKIAELAGTLHVDGVCGSSDGASLAQAPSTNLCSAGIASSVSGVGPWTWSCVGLRTDFCSANIDVWIPFGSGYVMKYEAKYQAEYEGGVPASRPDLLPWVIITQTAAIAACESIGAHLITNDEWMALARDIESVPSNWTGAVLNRGHTDLVPLDILAASTDSDPYYGTGQTTGDQKRTHTLSNGEVIWDFSGNAEEWNSDTRLTEELPVEEQTFQEINSITYTESLPYSAVGPANTALTNAANGIGLILPDPNGAGWYGSPIHAFIRSGQCCSWVPNAGVFSLSLHASPDYTGGHLGFRCAK